MENRIYRKAVVSGKVQGVWYRASTQRRAQQLKLEGWARNLSNGDVEVLVCGASGEVDELLRWLHQGPPLARVKSVEVEAVEPVACEGFTTG
ncbi:acylphosphatase [Aestuariirhabdus litorea]|uniref:acylphosphatase n=1 Tax=Aestuariirhabdus litorea TaxID=2528527 RepID=A0A3P3VN24_9GAMM|nr:acylphosphatase [Aestuariirhabdus litorea]RRJ84161.1 acylphosphatase [Aestuariirhabdus litorea]RWW97381.1 acylphosphatase [Endozoicomonadaceae bacterium GTF-13]